MSEPTDTPPMDQDLADMRSAYLAAFVDPQQLPTADPIDLPPPAGYDDAGQIVSTNDAGQPVADSSDDTTDAGDQPPDGGS